MLENIIRGFPKGEPFLLVAPANNCKLFYGKRGCRGKKLFGVLCKNDEIMVSCINSSLFPEKLFAHSQ